MKEYQVVVYQESMIGTLMLGQSKVDPAKLAEFINNHARNGWRVITMEREQRRMLLVSSREAFLIVMERDRK